jgi:hypothetical protein
MRASLLVLVIVLGGCSAPHNPTHPAPPASTTIKTSIKPASITIDPSTGWGGAPTADHMPVYTDLENFIQFFPERMQGSIIIQRRGGGENPDTGYLGGHVTVPTAATLYIALRTQIDDTVLITPEQLLAFAKEGWTRVPGIFGLSELAIQHSRWQVWSHPLDPGPVTLTSKALPEGGIFFIGRVH